MRMYQLEIPTKIYFGRGIAFQALAEEKVFLNGNVLIVTTGRSLNRLGYVEKLKKELRKRKPHRYSGWIWWRKCY